MASKMQRSVRAILAGGLALMVSACGSGSSDSTTTTPPTVVLTSQEDKFGTAFGKDYRVTANAEPATTADGDIVPVSLTTEPIDVN